MPTEKKIKILHWPTSYPDPARGKPYDCIFVKEHIVSVAPYCQNRVLFTSSDPPTNGKWVEIIATIEDEIPTDRIYFKTVRPLWVTNIYVRIVLFFYFLRLIFAERFYPDILHIHFHQAGLIAMLFCRIFRIKMVVTEHWTAFIGYPEIAETRFQKAKSVFNFAQTVLPVSEHLLKGIEKKTELDLSGKSIIINNSVDANIFTPPKRFVDNALKTILMVVRLDEQKDLPTFIQAVGILKLEGFDFRVKIIGKGDSSQYYSAINHYNVSDNILFLGEKSKREIAIEMSDSDVLCLSSISENSPCVIGEALCTGLPVVSTNVGGIPELLDESNGILVPPREPETLAKALITALWERKFERNTISEKARQHFSFPAIGQQLFDVYQKMIF